MGASAVFTFNFLPVIAGVMTEVAQKLVDEIATDVLDLAVANCPERTGFLASSIYLKTPDMSTYGQGGVAPPGDSFMVPETDTPPRNTDYVAVAANYGIYVEFGTRFMSAEPYLIPALEQVVGEVDTIGGNVIIGALKAAGVP